MTATASSKSQRWRWTLTISIGVIILLTVLAAPSNPYRSGSTYGRSPDGYGAWYQFMADRGTPVQRWQKPADQLSQLMPSSAAAEPTANGNVAPKLAMLEVHGLPRVENLLLEQQPWVEAGNRLVILGVEQPATQTEFRKFLRSDFGPIVVETTRRKRSQGTDALLRDRFGAVVWRQTVGQGDVIYASTPYLGANAYQNTPGNYRFLAELLTAEGRVPWVNEYIHGYKDQDVQQQEGTGHWFTYLARTPILPAVIQIFLVLLVVIWAKNQRFGLPKRLTPPTVDNSTAYIEALASVLHKSGSREFLVETIGREEQRRVQQMLGLGTELLDAQTLTAAWVQQTGRPASDLERALRPYWQRQSLGEGELLPWLQAIRNLHRDRRQTQPNL